MAYLQAGRTLKMPTSVPCTRRRLLKAAVVAHPVKCSSARLVPNCSLLSPEAVGSDVASVYTFHASRLVKIKLPRFVVIWCLGIARLRN
jgi:hypothetical protein